MSLLIKENNRLEGIKRVVGKSNRNRINRNQKEGKAGISFSTLITVVLIIALITVTLLPGVSCKIREFGKDKFGQSLFYSDAIK